MSTYAGPAPPIKEYFKIATPGCRPAYVTQLILSFSIRNKKTQWKPILPFVPFFRREHFRINSMIKRPIQVQRDSAPTGVNRWGATRLHLSLFGQWPYKHNEIAPPAGVNRRDATRLPLSFNPTCLITRSQIFLSRLWGFQDLFRKQILSA